MYRSCDSTSESVLIEGAIGLRALPRGPGEPVSIGATARCFIGGGRNSIEAACGGKDRNPNGERNPEGRNVLYGIGLGGGEGFPRCTVTELGGR